MVIETTFAQQKIVPDVLAEAPKSSVKILFKNNEVSLGNELTPRQVKSPPTLSWEAETGALYTLIFSDPDAEHREFLHWIVGNIPGTDLGKGEVVTEFISSAPPKGTGLHRYVFLLYKQKGKIQFEKTIATASKDERRHFKAAKFAEKYGLELIAGNFYLAQYDDYVEEMNKKQASKK